jgi:hypothetical protein
MSICSGERAKPWPFVATTGSCSGSWTSIGYIKLNQDLGEQKDQSAAQSALFRRLKEALAGWESELIPPRCSPASIEDFELDGIKMKLKV